MAFKVDIPDDTQPAAAEGLSAFAPYLMNRIMGRYNANIRARMSALGLSTAKMRALAVLSVADGMPINMLGIYAVVEQSTLSRALDQLQAAGLVERITDTDDQRSFRVHLTDRGQRVTETLWPHMNEEQDAMFRGIDDAERAAFMATLHRILANIRTHDF